MKRVDLVAIIAPYFGLVGTKCNCFLVRYGSLYRNDEMRTEDMVIFFILSFVRLCPFRCQAYYLRKLMIGVHRLFVFKVRDCVR